MKIYFAGGEQTTLSKALLENGVRDVLYSYFYILTHNRRLGVSEFQKAYPEVSWFLDSGAFTHGSAVKLGGNIPPAVEYVKLFFDYVDRYGENFDRIAEPDLDIAGQSVRQVRNWREEMLASWPDLPITPVWHVHRGPDEWEALCKDKRIRHLAFGSDVDDLGMASRMANMALERGKTVHGFAMTRMKVAERVRLTSVDSTSWATGNRYGMVYVWAGNKFVQLDAQQKHMRKQYARYYKAVGVDMKKILEDDSHELRKLNIISWRLLSERWQEKAKRRMLTETGEGVARASYPMEREEQ